jgi:hypothetical protein
MAPSVIYIDDAEKVFLSDKKKLKEFGSQVRGGLYEGKGASAIWVGALYTSFAWFRALSAACQLPLQSTSPPTRPVEHWPLRPRPGYPALQEPFNRIKKELLKECKSLGAGDRVLVLGNSREPYLCTKKDEKAFMGFWSKHIFLPAPDYASRRVCGVGGLSRQGRGLVGCTSKQICDFVLHVAHP